MLTDAANMAQGQEWGRGPGCYRSPWAWDTEWHNLGAPWIFSWIQYSVTFLVTLDTQAWDIGTIRKCWGVACVSWSLKCLAKVDTSHVEAKTLAKQGSSQNGNPKNLGLSKMWHIFSLKETLGTILKSKSPVQDKQKDCFKGLQYFPLETFLLKLKGALRQSLKTTHRALKKFFTGTNTCGQKLHTRSFILCLSLAWSCLLSYTVSLSAKCLLNRQLQLWSQKILSTASFRRTQSLEEGFIESQHCLYCSE